MNQTPTIAIIGAGYTGSLVAYHLLQASQAAKIYLIDKRKDFGLGTAYSTPFQHHLLNVPAKGMSALAHEPLHFVDWLTKNKSLFLPAENIPLEDQFVPRAIYGQYIQSLLAELEQTSRNECQHITQAVTDLTFNNAQQAMLDFADGTQLKADIVILAVGNFGASNGFAAHIDAEAESKILQPWDWQAIQKIHAEENVLIVGSGLTMVDAVLSLQAQGHRGQLHAISRHGYLPKAHPRPLQSSIAPFSEVTSPLSLLRLFKKSLKQTDHSWYQLIDSLRPITQQIWQCWSIKQRRQFAAHLRAKWDVHRHRIAPEIAEQLTRALQSEQLQTYAGKIDSIVTGQPDKVLVRWHERNQPNKHELEVDHIINCTGMSNIDEHCTDLLLKNLFTSGLIKSDGMAIDTDQSCRVINNKTQLPLYAVGPITRGRLFEIIAVPDIRQQVEELCEQLIL